MEVCSSGGQGTGGSHKKVPDDREAAVSQDPMRMTLAKIPNKGGIELVETISSCWAWLPFEGWCHPATSKILIQNSSYLKEMQGQRVEQRSKERPPRDCST